MGVTCMGRLGRYIGAGGGVVYFWLVLPMNCWVPMSGGHILIVNWLTVWMWSWFMVGVLDRMVVGRFNRNTRAPTFPAAAAVSEQANVRERRTTSLSRDWW